MRVLPQGMVLTGALSAAQDTDVQVDMQLMELNYSTVVSLTKQVLIVPECACCFGLSVCLCVSVCVCVCVCLCVSVWGQVLPHMIKAQSGIAAVTQRRVHVSMKALPRVRLQDILSPHRQWLALWVPLAPLGTLLPR